MVINMQNNDLEKVIVYLITYFDAIKDIEEHIIVFMTEDTDVISDMDKQIFKYLYPSEIYQGEISIIKSEMLYTTSRIDLQAYPFLEIFGDK